jgi:hypothetical protein
MKIKRDTEHKNKSKNEEMDDNGYNNDRNNIETKYEVESVKNRYEKEHTQPLLANSLSFS